MGRILNYGGLVIQSAGENEGLTIQDVPDVEDIQRDVYQFIEADEQRRRGGGTNRAAARQLDLSSGPERQRRPEVLRVDVEHVSAGEAGVDRQRRVGARRLREVGVGHVLVEHRPPARASSG